MNYKHSICRNCKIQFEYVNKGKIRVFCSISCYREVQINNGYKKELKTIRPLDFLSKAKLAHGDKYTYLINSELFSNGYIIITCPVHGDFKQKIHNHLKGHGCQKCGFEITKTKQALDHKNFTKKSILVHGNTYRYPEDNGYVNSKTSVGIVCNIHGLFFQTPSNHLKGKGCRKCGIEKSSGLWRADKYIKLCDDYHNGLSRLYLIKCYNDTESFYKVGITTKTVKNRFRGSKSMPYSFDVISEIKENAGFIHGLELQIHRLLKKYKYIPYIYFAGNTECFSQIPEDILKMINTKSKELQINLI